MTLRLYNSLTRQKEEFVPLNAPKVLFYNCGPTVYGEFHIGNARNFVVFDTIRRWLLVRGYDVNYVHNITDIDDKIINRAIEEGTTAEAIAEKYTAYFFKKLNQLGILPATSNPRATQHMHGIVELIRTLEQKGHAYATSDGSVWFDISSFPEYGKLSRMPMDQMQQGERLDAGQQSMKRNGQDFALWKASKPGEPAWDSPWGAGRPGWHIECSCMAIETLGAETIDIHGGGVDLRFPHHENEIAQSEGATGKPFARYWLHNGMLDIDGQKMSKSLGNVRSLDDMLALVDALTLRYFLISARYRDKLDFTDDNINKCRSAVQRLVTASREADRVLCSVTADDAWSHDPEFEALHREFGEAMDDDFNTARALGVLGTTITLVNKVRQSVEDGEPVRRLARAAALLNELRESLGLTVALERAASEIDEELSGKLRALYMQSVPAPLRVNPQDGAQLVEALITARATARKEKNFQLGDAIRNELAALGIVLEDKAGETNWKRE